ncbi:glycerophosphodiester phosphodiesterase GDPDL4-like isoform X2 [Papaver somniferum]|uniref:glycerophosphodiester phosphodiesterase GDPDL4-like isoform X2 n=1 Tax=Papaver somniferum TaxID=3469 RepID=UPI000E6F7BBD|nr:glycerophosphodiester phosphodiesterase GDPDL4-like isoform X2 [Papaver somniferum]
MSIIRALFFVCVLHSVVTLKVSAQRSTKKASAWQTLTGNEPLVIARGGLSGLFPDSSFAAYDTAMRTSVPNVVLWCDVQLTKDGIGICLPDLRLDNFTSIEFALPNTSSTYLVNGVSTKGWFSVDYDMDFLQKNIFLLTVTLLSSSNSKYGFRTERFDGNMYAVLAVEDVASQNKPSGFWLNVQHDSFFTQHYLSMRSYVISVSKRVVVNYISSPEVGFLRGIATRFKTSKTKLVFRFLGAADTEPSTNQTYGSLLKNLTFIKVFASGILVPKSYIWPVTAGYLLPHTSVVLDAHKQGLEVYASDFANDATFSYNYSYNPLSEYLSSVDNGDFSVDGVLSGFPITASAAIGCFAHMNNSSSGQDTPSVISHKGASGMFPGCTDLAYNQAVADGANYIDCSVQMTKDGLPVCLRSINLLDGTDVAQSAFGSFSVIIPEIQENPGIFTFNLTWEETKTLKPVISNPSFDYQLFRNPANKNAGSFVSLAEFLTLALSKPLSGVLINIEHAAYLADKQGLGITDSVIDVLNKSGYKNETTQEVIIQSTNKAVLTAFKAQSSYKRMYMVDEDISFIDDSSIKDIKSFADSVAIGKESIFPSELLFLTGSTKVVPRLHSFNLSVYAYLFRNEFVSQAWDFFSDPIVEINSYVMGGEIDGVITDFPATAASYKKSRCLTGKTLPPYMMPAKPGQLLELVTPQYLPPAEAPNPISTDSDVSEPPSPPVSKQAVSNAPTPSKSNAYIEKMAGFYFSSVSMFFASLLLQIVM